MTQTEALTIALDFIERVNKDGWILADFEPQMYEVITAIKEALAQPEQEPVAWKETDEVECPVCKDKGFPWPKCGHITYLEPAPPPQRTWVGLTDMEVQNIVYCRSPNIANLRKAEQLLKDKNK